MKVGIYLGKADPRIGGGYVFEHTFLKILEKQGGNLPHHFTVFSPVDIKDEFPGLDTAVLDRSGFRANARDKARLLLKMILHGREPGGLVDAEGRKINQYLASKRIEFMIYPRQGEYLSLDVPYMTTVWDLQHRLQPYFPEVSVERAWQKREATLALLIHRSSYVLTGTRSCGEDIQSFYNVPPGKIIVNPMPVPELVEVMEPDREHGLNFIRDFLLYPAQFWPHKNHVTILKALKHLRDEHGLILDLVFTGSDKGNGGYINSKVMEFGLEGQVHNLGFIDGRELAVLYKRAFALTFMSLFGPDNLPPLEAFSAGCPVIAAKIPGAQEQLEDAAYFVDPLSAEDLANGIYRLYMDKSLRESLVSKGYEISGKLQSRDYFQPLVECLGRFEKIRSCWHADLPYKRL